VSLTDAFELVGSFSFSLLFGMLGLTLFFVPFAAIIYVDMLRAAVWDYLPSFFEFVLLPFIVANMSQAIAAWILLPEHFNILYPRIFHYFDLFISAISGLAGLAFGLKRFSIGMGVMLLNMCRMDVNLIPNSHLSGLDSVHAQYLGILQTFVYQRCHQQSDQKAS
jgi:hypothetical protein